MILIPGFYKWMILIPGFYKSYVVYLGSHSHGSEAKLSDIKRVKNSHYELLGSFTKSKEEAKNKIFYSYTKNINGFAAMLEDEEAAQLAKHPEVISVFLNKGKKLHTTRSWSFLGLERDGWIPVSSLWTRARKLIGGRYFNKGYAAFVGPLNSTYNTSRDNDSGHGTHTLSTAGGNFVPGANVFGNGNGTASGGSPNARVAAYKVCWPPVNGSGECFDADIMAAFDAAISDGVNVISVSLGGDTPAEFFEDSIAIGAFHASRKGIVVVASAGNAGPAPLTVTNSAPWLITVGASTLDREFTSYVALGNRRHLKGTSLSEKGLPAAKFYPLISGEGANAADSSAGVRDSLCLPGTLDPKKVKGKILVCLRGITGRVEKGEEALLAGAVGMILANDEFSGNELIADAHVLPAAHVNFTDGQAAIAYINSTRIPVAFITRVKTELETKPAPSMAAFSSRGPNIMEPSILKPDITAPGVDIIASFSLAVSPSGEEFDKRRISFNTDSGTSMSCPHVSGIAGLLKTLHPDWSPASIRSAIVTSARTRGNNLEPILDSATNLKATPFDYGAGHIRPNRAMDPGLVYDLTENDYLNFLCARGYNQSQIKLFLGKPYPCPKSFSLADFNYPSIIVPNLNESVTVTRRVKNVGSPGEYFAYVKAPPGVSVLVKPKNLKFKRSGEEKTFQVTLKSTSTYGPRDYVFGRLVWSDGKHFVKSPLVVKQ
ncbi:hypothetical protein GH714_002769 [Hevea brasiliensis]|uniref:Uncharacterized protein n=1 Tax=Hevea brasiliensis TaxID=3981 RepID=A0A6A6NFE7_HEVBR|nr:hypothetical protein GH714_002769 [Hevea brasiliensis]